MSEEVAKNAIDKIDAYCMANNIEEFELIYYGGEPLINKNIIAYIYNYQKKLKTEFKYSIITNATLIDEDIAKLLKKVNCNVAISIDGPKEINDKNRLYANKDKSVYDAIIKNINYLKNEKVDFTLSITLSEYLIKNKAEVLEWLKNLEVKNVAFNLLHMTEQNANWNELYEKSSQFVFEAKKVLNGVDITEDRSSRSMESFINKKFTFNDCGATGCNQLTIKPNGDVTICHANIKTDKQTLGNIKILSIDELINNKNNKDWVKRSPINKKKCLKCNAIFTCGGGCANQSYHVFGGIKNIDKAFCIFSKKAHKEVLIQSYLKSKDL